MKYILYILFVIPLLAKAQEVIQSKNLVPNPGFEDKVVCPNHLYTIPDTFKSKGWSSFGGTPDYFNFCKTGFSDDVQNNVGVPNNLFGYQQDLTGSTYAGLYSFIFNDGGYREFLGCELISSLIPGVKYYVKIKVNLADSCNCATNNLGIAFSKVQYQDLNSIPVSGQAKIYSKAIISDTMNWINISGSFIADSAYKYLIIGNFFSDISTKTLKTKSGFFYGVECAAYYYIDDVCVSTDSNACYLTTGVEPGFDESKITFYPNPSGDKFSFKSRDTCSLTMGLYNMLGEKKKEVMNCEENSIDVSDVPPGVYVIVIRKGLKFLQGEKVIVIH